ncbi:MAG: MFS transporter [Acidobacteria bacterium]|nr:MFS transporter [Acidobacteriota bacterium]
MDQTIEKGAAVPVTNREILGWCMYDVADSAFTTIIVTVLYAPYFAKIVVRDPQQADFLWGLAASISEVVVALIAPILGAIADFSGSRKKFLGVCAVTIVLFTASLWFVGPGMTYVGLTLYILANIGFAGGGVFIDSFLPGISNNSNAGRISGRKWAMGYMSGLVCLALCYPLANGNIVDNATNEQISTARLIPLVVAIYYAIAVIPTFLWLKEKRPAAVASRRELPDHRIPSVETHAWPYQTISRALQASHRISGLQ